MRADAKKASVEGFCAGAAAVCFGAATWPATLTGVGLGMGANYLLERRQHDTGIAG